MIIRVVLFIGNRTCLPDNSLWYATFRGVPNITVTESRVADSDAALVSISRCEKFGCRTGAPNAPHNSMTVYDSVEFEPANDYFPRYQISNAILNPKPSSLSVHVRNRIRLLDDAIASFNRSHNHVIKSVNIDCSCLGEWLQFPIEEQRHAVSACRDELQEWLTRDSAEGKL